MPTPTSWKGYSENFLEGFSISLPRMNAVVKADAATNNETGKHELPFIYFTAVQSMSRRMPIFTATNMFRDNLLGISADDKFGPDKRIEDAHQLTTTLYSNLNLGHKPGKDKMAKGHMTRREDVQWDADRNEVQAEEASDATFHYTNACPQYQGVNGGVWKNLEDSILRRGRSREPKRCTIFTGPVFSKHDPWLRFQNDVQDRVKCPMHFWKVVYWVNENNELNRAGFRMSHEDEVRGANFVYDDKIKTFELFEEKVELPFLEFNNKEKYQVSVEAIEKLTGLAFAAASEKLRGDEHRKLSVAAVTEKMNALTDEPEVLVEGLDL